MNKKIFWMATALALLSLPGLSAAGSDSELQERALEKFKGLAGQWQGVNSKGEPVQVGYEVIGDGSTVLERFRMGGRHDMATLYHMDGQRLVLTHYCIAGNQPKMEAASVTDTEVRFRFLEAGNLQSPDEGHMHTAVFKFGEERLTTEWTWRENGEDAFTEVVQLQRAP